jgi:hypothetical protein
MYGFKYLTLLLLLLFGLSGCLLTKVVTVPMRIGGAVTSIVPVVRPIRRLTRRRMPWIRCRFESCCTAWGPIDPGENPIFREDYCTEWRRGGTPAVSCMALLATGQGRTDVPPGCDLPVREYDRISCSGKVNRVAGNQSRQHETAPVRAS